jgi:hypothetical protein
LKNDDVVEESNHYAQAESFQESEGRQKNKIPWVRMTFPVENTKVD